MAVTALLACLNEAKRIRPVLDVLTSSPLIDHVIVADGGSTDGTLEVVNDYDVELVVWRHGGKGGGVTKALEKVKTDITLMCDADLIGFEERHVEKLLHPVLDNPQVMTVGMLDKYWHMGLAFIKDHFYLIPINGTRAIWTHHLRNASKNELFEHWGIESVINSYCRRADVKLQKVNLDGVRDVVKTRKQGFGINAQFYETINVSATRAKLHASDAHYQVQKLQRENRERIRQLIGAGIKGRANYNAEWEKANARFKEQIEQLFTQIPKKDLIVEHAKRRMKPVHDARKRILRK